ncbi:hypothetical protein BDR04DRAFT_1101051 [Suillus decipiens]|nr:hypothetical protein BDR04DRAFT_1101051 [Suillus decipiens]
MKFLTTLAYLTLATAARQQPIISSNIEPIGPSQSDKTIIEEGSGVVKCLSDNPSKISDVIHEEFDSLSTPVHKWYELQFPDTGESFLDKVVELGPNIKEYADELSHNALALYPSEKLTEFRESIVSVTDAATALREVCSGAAEDNGISLYSVMEEYGDIFAVLFEDLMEMFPPPGEAPGHDNRTIMFNAILDRFEEGFLQVATKLGVSEELSKSHLSPLKFVVQDVAVTIGDLIEQHPDITKTLLLIAIAEFSPLLLPEFGPLLQGWILRPFLRLLGFGPQGPIKGKIAAWLQRWMFRAAIPKGSWFSVLQRLAMIGTKL